MKRKLFALLFFAAAASAYSFDFNMVLQYYLPSLRGAASGKNTVWNRFAGAEDAGTFSLPLEIKLNIGGAGPVAFHAIGGYIFYRENGIDGLASCPVSLGLGLGSKSGKNPTGMWGFYGNIYPLYEFPVATFGRDPVVRWKIAVDLGYSISFLFNQTLSNPDAFQSLYASVYIRTIGALEQKKGNRLLADIPDIGIAIGFHLYYPKKRAAPPEVTAE